MDALRFGGSQVERVIRSQRKSNHSNAALAITGALVEEMDRILDLRFSLEVIFIERLSERFRARNRICDLAVIEVRGKGDEAGIGQAST